MVSGQPVVYSVYRHPFIMYIMGTLLVMRKIECECYYSDTSSVAMLMTYNIPSPPSQKQGSDSTETGKVFTQGRVLTL